jgi:hypothetical protein
MVDESDALDTVVEVVGLDRELFDREEVAVTGAHLRARGCRSEMDEKGGEEERERTLA